jgi:hypothetical protein
MDYFLLVLCFAPPPRLIDRHFYFTRFHYVPVTLVASRTFSIPSCLSHSKLTSQLVLARSMAAFIFCGGNKVAAMPLVRARLVPRRLPPQPPYACAGAPVPHSDLP